jgi:tetratricopeptide (TPR) repeat protein
MKRPLMRTLMSTFMHAWLFSAGLFMVGAFANQSPVDLPAATSSFKAGNAAYERGDFSGAVDAYAAAEQSGAYDARLFYNHANALFRTNKLGLSILYYERAHKLAPTDPDVLHNLNFARSRVADKISDPPANAFTTFFWRIHSSYSLRDGLWYALGIFTAGFLLLAVSLFLPPLGRVALVLLATLAFISWATFATSLVYKVRQQDSAARVVVLHPVVELYSGPGESYELLFRAHEGTVFSIVSREGEWVAVKLSDGRGGFVMASKVGEV